MVAFLNRIPVLHPFLMGLYPPLALYAHAINNLFFETTLSGFAISIGFSIVPFTVFWLVFRDPRKAGVLTTTLIVFAFFYGHFNTLLASTMFADRLTLAGELPHKIESYILRGWGIGFGLLLIWLCWRKAAYVNLTKILNVVAATLVAVPAATIAYHLVTSTAADVAAAPAPTATDGGPRLAVKGAARDIYYLIFDRYGSAGALAERFEFDNRPFLDALGARGFYVATESVGNYMSSHHSVASSLNMIYLDYLTEKLGRQSGNVNPLSELVQDHAIQRLLKSAGYKYYHLGSTWEVSRLNRNADVNFSGKAPNEFLSVLMKTNAIPAIARKWDIQIQWFESKCFRSNAKFNMLKRIAERAEPTFTFAHMLLPHEPYVFDSDGRCMSKKEADARDWRTNYLAQIHYTNDKILEVVDSLIRASDRAPVIVIQGDEGPYPDRFVERYLRGEKFSWRAEATDSEWRQKMGILNALYLPDVKAKGLHPRLTPVNNFRIVFNAYFGTDFPLLPDRSFSFTDIDHAYDFFEITDRVYRVQ